MLDLFIEIVLSPLLELFCWYILWPVVLIVATPFVVLKATVVALCHKERYFDAVSDGYWSVSELWKEWAL